MNNFKPDYNFYQLTPAIFLLEMDGNQHLAHTFLRAQEFYESGNENFRNQEFSLKDYQDWYCTQSKDGTFSYGEDWRGFNIPSSVIENCYSINKERTVEDMFFLSICEKAKTLALQAGCNSYYILGVRKGDTKTLEHEIAHGLFYTNIEYQKLMISAVKAIEPDVINPLFENLIEMGYGENVLVDESQAYLSTGLKDSQKCLGLKDFIPQFRHNFEMFMEGWKMPTPLEENIVKG